MVTGPATYVVLLLVGLLLIIGVVILGSGRATKSDTPTPSHCPHCNTENPPQASFCAQCGERLDRSSVDT